jgi:transporter family-2 protein
MRQEGAIVNASLFATLSALAAGAAISVQSSLSGLIGRTLGVLESAFVVHLGGLVLAGAIMLGLRGGNLGAWRSVPWYAYGAGFVGVVIIAAVSYTVPRLGLATTLTLTIVAQLLLGAFLDHIGWLGAAPRPLDATRLLGMAVLLAGTWLVVR